MILKNEYGKSVRFITTGVAGENLSCSANLMTENDGSVTGGFGAVFGSKNLKAIAVMGSGEAVINRKGQTLNRKTYGRMLKEFYKIRGWDPVLGH